MAYQVLILSSNLSPLAAELAHDLKAQVLSSRQQLQASLKNPVHILVLDYAGDANLDLSECDSIHNQDLPETVPLVVLTAHNEPEDRIRALEVGCDDLIDSRLTKAEIIARINKSIFNQIATRQLNQRLLDASQTAKLAMVDASDLGANIQFLLKIQECNNLDELGQQFFVTAARYLLTCSLQMRSAIGHKDMEPNGMAKDLESQLMLQMKDQGRFLDFGRRTIINFDRVSLLIKNMPVDNPEKYGIIKDNIFSLLQGMNARIMALEDQMHLQKHTEKIQKLNSDVRLVMNALKDGYQDVFAQIAREIENLAERIEDKVPHFALTEVDERFIYQSMAKAVSETNRIFSEGLKIDELFMRLDKALSRSLETSAKIK